MSRLTEEEVQELFEKHSDVWFLKEHGPRPDLKAFILMDKLCPGDDDCISAAEHDVIYFCWTCEDLANAGITEEQIIQLLRYGVMYMADGDGLGMFA